MSFSGALTVGASSRVYRVELARGRDEADGRLHAVVGVVSRGALDQVGRGGCQTVLVEQTRDARGGHAAPVVVVAGEQPCQHRDLRVACIPNRLLQRRGQHRKKVGRGERKRG